MEALVGTKQRQCLHVAKGPEKEFEFAASVFKMPFSISSRTP